MAPAKARELACGDELVLTRLAGRKLWSCLCESDVYVHLSRHEGFPWVIAEAIWAGKRAILSRETGSMSCKEVSSLPYVQVDPRRVGDAARAMRDFVEGSAALAALARSYAPRIRHFFS